ncbi:Protein of unknown function [Propionibacterium freudenreichii]|nr:Protein of unknown function [Propionibacterium freudenreichii]
MTASTKLPLLLEGPFIEAARLSGRF